MKAGNVRVLKAFAVEVLDLEADVMDLLPKLRIFGTITRSEHERLKAASDCSERCNLLLLNILPTKKDSELDTLMKVLKTGWSGLAETLQELIDEEATTEGTAAPGAPLLTNVPSVKDVLRQRLGAGHKNLLFTGREEILKQLNQELVEKDPEELAAVSLTGTGGIGKSTIALQFCHQFCHLAKEHGGAEEPFFAWLQANTAERLVEELESLGGILGIPKPPHDVSKSSETVMALKTWLAANPGWLLVLDDLSEDAFEILKNTLPNSGGSVLITSRLRISTDWITRIEVPELSESAELLGKVIGKIKPADFEDLKEQLASKTLGALPLAIMHAGSYIKTRSCSIADYLERFKQSAAILNEKLRGIQFEGPQQVLTTWDLTMDFLRNENQDTFRYLGICSFLANNIEDGFMNSAPVFQQSSESETKKRVEDAKTLLILFSMLTPMEAGVKIHALVQEAVLIRSSEDEKLSSFANGAVALDKQRNLNPDRLRTLFAHGESMLKRFSLNFAKIISKNASNVLKSNYKLVVTVFLGSVFSLRIKLPNNFLDGILNAGIALFGIDSQEMGDIFFNVGSAFGVNGDYEKKREFLEKALELRKDDINHFEVATILHNLGFCFYQLGDLHKAKEILEKTMQILQTSHEDKQEAIANNLRCLGLCYGGLGEHQKEKEVLERAMEIIKSLNSPYNIKLAVFLDSLGNCYESFGDFQKMMQMHEASLKIFENFYGKDHVVVAGSLLNISNFYAHTGDHKRQQERLERALSICQDFYGDINHSLIANVLSNLGSCYLKLGGYHIAKNTLQKALEMTQSLFGENHFEVGQTLNNLATCFDRLGDYETQREMLERALKIKESFYGGNHEDVAGTLYNLGICYFCLKNNSQSIVSLKRAIEIFKSGFNVVNLFYSYFQMSKTLVQISKESNSSEAVKNLREAKLYLEKARSLLQENRDNPQLNGWQAEVETKEKKVDRLLIGS